MLKKIILFNLLINFFCLNWMFAQAEDCSSQVRFKDSFNDFENESLINIINSISECNLLYIDPDLQKMFYFSKNDFREYTISISMKEMNIEEGSQGTPWGLHKIDGKIGDGAQLGTVFQSRMPIGKFYWECNKEEFCGITTRILRLRGLEPGINNGTCGHRNGHNCDSYDRYIYIHGTRYEWQLGVGLSLGCILMSNKEVIELFNLIEEGTYVYIDGSMKGICRMTQ